MTHWDVVELGTAGFREVWARQLALVEQRQRGEVGDTLLVVEHPHVFTLGRSRAAEANVLAAGDVEVIAVERGGDVTYHGPGQLVVYPILQLAEGERDLHRYLRNLEEAAIRVCARFGLAAGREPGKTGVWSGGKKLASIGIACRKWVTFHGMALNVTTDLAYFQRINPCGFDAGVMTSLATHVAVTLDAARSALIDELEVALSRSGPRSRAPR